MFLVTPPPLGAKPVEALSFFQRREEGQPFDKLRASGV